MTYLIRRRLRAPFAVPFLDQVLAWNTRRLAEADLNRLDDRLRGDIGLPPRGNTSLPKSEIAARIALLALR